MVPATLSKQAALPPVCARRAQAEALERRRYYVAEPLCLPAPFQSEGAQALSFLSPVIDGVRAWPDYAAVPRVIANLSIWEISASSGASSHANSQKDELAQPLGAGIENCGRLQRLRRSAE